MRPYAPICAHLLPTFSALYTQKDSVPTIA